MKKKIVTLMLVSALSLSVVACGKNNNSDDSATATPTASPSIDEVAVLSADLTGYITLGDYKGLTIDEVDATVTDEEVEAEIETTLSNKATWDEQKDSYEAQEGDQVNIDYVGKLDGEAFDGGTAEATDIVLGSSGYIDGFDDGVIGHKKGETFDLTLTFPESYSNTDLAGKETVFTITVNSVSKQSIPELTDDYVAETLSETSKTVEEYKKEVREDLEATAKENKEAGEISNALQAAIDNAEVTEYPQEQLDYYENLVTSYYTNIATYYYGLSLEDFYTQSGFTADTWQSDVVTSSSEKMIKQVMVVKAIAKAEGIEVTDEEYEAELPTYLAQYSATDEAALIESYGEGAILSIKDELLYNKVGQFLVDNDTVETVTATATPAAE